MAKLDPQLYPGKFEIDCGEPWENEIRRTETLIDALYRKQPRPDSKTLVGAVLTFGVGDGYAMYVVTKDKPLTVQHVPQGDCWRADACTLRGINAAYVRQVLGRTKLFHTNQ